MSIEVLRTYRFQCDATACLTSVLSETAEAPSDWSTISSRAHHLDRMLPSVKSPRARLRAMGLESMRSVGRFQLHLCPQHQGALAEHLPRTDNPGGQGIIASCSCGAQLGLIPRNAKAVWLGHFQEASRASAREQTSPSERDRMT